MVRQVNPATRWAVLVAGSVILCAGCDQRTSAPPLLPQLKSEPRIVSLAPAITQILVDMGVSDSLVAVAQNDSAAPSPLPVVGNYVDLDIESLLATAPTHVLMMTGKEGAPKRLTELAAAGRFALMTYPSPQSVEDVARTLYDEAEDTDSTSSTRSLGSLLGKAEQARKVKEQMLIGLDRLRALFADMSKPKVLMVIGTNPIMASGPDTVHDQLLETAGASNAAASATVGAPTYDRESLVGMDPEIILLLLPNAEPLIPIDRDPRLASFRDLPIKAVDQGHIVLINDPLVLLPSSSLTRIARAMAKAIHPDHADAIEETLVLQTAPSRRAESSVLTEPSHVGR